MRKPTGSAVDAFEPRIREQLQAFPTMPATVIAERVGWDRGMTVFKERVRELRPWRTSERPEVDSEGLVREVLDKFEPVADAIREARNTTELEVVLGLIIYMIGDIQVDGDEAWADVPTPALAFSLETVERIAKLGCHLDVDQYVSAPDDE